MDVLSGYGCLFGVAGEPVCVLRPAITYDEAMDEEVSWSAERVDNVLFGYPTAEDISNADRLHGMRATYRLCFPKGYTAPLSSCMVVRAADLKADPMESDPKWAVITDAPPLPESLCPTQWNREVIVGVENG